MVATAKKTGETRGRKAIQFDLTEVEKLASHGLTERQIYLCLGISHETFYKNKRINIEFTEALEKGKATGLALVSNALFENALEGNTTAQIFYMKCRGDFGQWPDRREITGPGGQAIPILQQQVVHLEGATFEDLEFLQSAIKRLPAVKKPIIVEGTSTVVESPSDEPRPE